MKNVLLILSLLLIHSAAIAQESFWDKYSINSFDISDGLPNNTINDIHKDNIGYLWFATDGGLARYDGYSFECFDANSDIKLRSNYIQEVCSDKFNRLWVAGDAGLDIISLEKIKNVTNQLLGSPEDTPEGVIFGLTADRDGNIWIAAGNTLWCFSFYDDGSVKYSTHIQCDGKMTALSLIGTTVWVACGNTVNTAKTNMAGEITLEKIDIPDFDRKTLRITCFDSNEHGVWLGTDAGLYKVDLALSEIKHYTAVVSDKKSLTDNNITALLSTGAHEFVVATSNGLNIYDPQTDSFEQIIQATSKNSKTISSNVINCMLVSGDRLWVGTAISGVDMFISNDLSIKCYVNTADPSSIGSDNVTTIVEDKFGNTWVGTADKGLSILNKNSETFKHLTKESHGLTNNHITSLAVGRTKTLWVGSEKGIDIIDMSDPRLPIIETFHNRVDATVNSIVYDRMNANVWIFTEEGLSVYNKGVSAYTPIHRKISGANGACIDNQGFLWVGTSDGLMIINLNTFTVDTVEYRFIDHKLDDPTAKVWPRVTYCYVASDGVMYIGTNGYGLYLSHDGGATFEQLTTKDGLLNNSVKGIIEDVAGNIWISTNRGLSVYDPFNRRFSSYTTENGMLSDNYNLNAVYKSPTNGKLFFGTNKGMVEIQQRVMTSRTFSDAKPIITNLLVSNKSVQPESDILDNHISLTKSITLSESEKSFAIEFASLSNTKSSNLRFQYQLEGFDEEWIETTGTHRIALYNNIPHGEYTFVVRCCDINSGWSDSTQLEIIIKPSFFKSVWFYALLALILLIVIVRVAKYNSKHQAEQNRLSQQIIQQRTDELIEQRKLLDDLQSELTGKQAVIVEQQERLDMHKTILTNMARKIQNLSVDKFRLYSNLSSDKVINAKFTPCDIVSLVRDTIQPCAVIASKRGISVKQYLHVHENSINIDETVTKRIISLILSCLIDHTADHGAISVYCATSIFKNTNSIYICVGNMPGNSTDAQADSLLMKLYSKNDDPAADYADIQSVIMRYNGEIYARYSQRHSVSIRVLLPISVGQTIATDGRTPSNNAGGNAALQSSPTENERIAQNDDLAIEILNHIHNHYTDPDYSVDDIVKDLGCSRGTVNNRLQAALGTSTAQYIRDYRLQIARQLILENRVSHEKNITQISAEVGFSDPKYFTRCFSKQYDVSPSTMLYGTDNSEA
ncbi:MAG: helix-turn-helix domain-containing protein [Bacteroidales bacterium]|nr:helix-turn-helix domain-containing protein [Bacteroidales bacterium]